MTILPIPLWAVFAIAAILYCVPAHAESYTAKSQSGDSVTLYTDPCPLKPWFANWRKASMIYHGKQYEACWRVSGETVVLIDSDGDFSAVSFQYFKRDEAI